MLTVNRLTNHLTAIGFLPSEPPPAVGESHYALVQITFKRSRIWQPRFIGDAPRSIDFDDVTYLDRHRHFLPALRQAMQFNSATLARKSDSPVREWRTVAFVENGPRGLADRLARTCTPMRFAVMSIIAPPKWKPSNMLDPPPVRWAAEYSARCLPWFRNADDAVRRAIKKNTNQKRCKLAGCRWRSVVAGFEADALHSAMVLDCAADGRSGTQSRHDAGRFHIVDSTWPLSAEVLASVKGGAV